MKITDATPVAKYYGTQLEVTLNDGRKVYVELSSDDPEPSALAIEPWGSRDEFVREVSDGHYEREATRIVADAVIAAMDKTSAYE